MKRKFMLMLTGFTIVLDTVAQRPENYPPGESGPLEINFVNVLIYFVIPVVILAAYIWTRRISYKKRTQQKKDNPEM